MTGADHLAVGLLRVVDPAGDALSARLSADRLLSAARPVARGLGAEQILVVHTLRDPRPGACGHPAGTAAVVRWRAAAGERLEEARALAARPAAGPVHPAANAVLFDDLAELLACLTIDAAAGVAATRWWWRAWLTDRSAASAVTRAWAEHVTHAPAALEVLCARQATASLARTLTPAAALAISAAIAAAYGLDGDAAISDDDAPLAPPYELVACDTRRPTGAPPPGPAAVGFTAAQARRLLVIVPELAQVALPREHRRLLGLGLTLHRHRRAARGAGFWSALGDLACGQDHVVAHPPSQGAAAGGGASAAATGSAVVAPDPARGPPPEALGRRTTSDPSPPSGPAGAQPGGEPPLRALARPSPRPAAPGSRTGDVSRVNVTPLGGLFLLPGVALHLGLYGDFSRPREPGLDLDLWDLVALLGRGLMPRAPHADPVWTLLGELADRGPGEPPGHHFRPPDAWRLPADWLAPFGPGRGPWRWRADGGRLRARHPAGFLALDVPLGRGRPAARLERELRRLGGPPTRHDPQLRLARAGDEPLDRWSRAWLAPYVGARLRLALNARTPSAAVALTLRRRARVTLSPARVDVTYALDELEPAIRRAGLDRTPGWIPAAGRHLEIHFA